MLAWLKSNSILIAILLLASVLRLYRIDEYLEFLGDQGRDAVIVYNFLKKGDLFFIGPQTSIGNMYLGPFYYYFFVVPGLLLTWFNPVGPGIIVALFGIATVYLIYAFTLRYFNKTSAIIASLLYSISPVVIKYSNFSWNPNIMPFFSLLFIIWLTKALTENKPKFLLLASLSYIICFNSHFLALLLLPFAGIITIFKLYFVRTNKSLLLNYIKYLIISIAVFLVSLLPLILFDIRHNGQNLSSFLQFFSQRETTVNLKAYKSLFTFFPVSTEIFNSLILSKTTAFGTVANLLFLLSGIVVLIIKSNPTYRLLFLWFVSGIAGLSLYKQHIYDHYFAFIFPLIFIIIAYILSLLPKKSGLLLVLVIGYFSYQQSHLHWPPNRQLQTTEEIVDSIIVQSANKPFNFALLAKQNYDPPYRYFFNKKSANIHLVNERLTEQLFVVCEPFQIDCNPINNPEWSVAAFGWAKIEDQWLINNIQIFRLTHNQ